MGKTHLVTAIAASELVCILTPLSLPHAAVFCAGGALGGLLPDLDHKNSTITHHTGFFGQFLNLFFSHRGVMHTIFFWALALSAIGLIFSGFTPLVYFLRGALFGVFTHLVLDSMNSHGIMWLYPFTIKRFHLLGIKSNGAVNQMLQLVGAVLCILFAAAYLFIVLF